MSAPPSDIQPEAEPLPAQMLHPLVQDHKFLAAAAAVFLAIIVYRRESRLARAYMYD